MTESQRNSSLISKIFFLVVVLFFVSIINTHAQFIDLQLDIDSRLTAQTEQPLDFGTLMTNSGRRMIELGNPNMGIFSITALENQMLLVTLDKPTELRHENPAINDVIPLELFSRYAYSPQNYEASSPLPGTVNSIKVEPNAYARPWSSIYIFMYGSVDIGDVRNGTYASDIVLSVVYI